MKTRERHSRTVWTALLIVAVTLILPACAAIPTESATESTAPDQPAAGAPEEITVGVGFVPSVQFAPFYVGIEKGFFRDAGLDVDLEYGFENDYLKLVGTGQTQFMVGSGDQVVLGHAQGLPVRYVMKWYTQYPVVVMALADAGIAQPADLAGKSIGIPGPFGASYVAFRGILEAGGLDERDVSMESIGFTQAAALSSGAVDAAVDYAANGPVVLAAEGMDTTQIALDDFLRIPANGLVTNDDTIRERPELVQAMVAATVRSVEYTLQNPDEAFEIALTYVPEAGGDNRDINRAVFDSSLEYWRPQGDDIMGASTREEWETAAEFMQRIGLVDTLVEAEPLFTNEFLP